MKPAPDRFLRPSRRPARPSSRRGFTLIELLTVVAIVGVLAALLLAVLGRVRASAAGSRCVANLHQVGVAIQAYVSDHKGSLPATGFFGVASYYNRDPRNFQNSLLPYLGMTESTSWSTAVSADTYSPVFDCPGYKGALGGKSYTLSNNVPDINGNTVKPWGTITDAQGSTKPAPQKLVNMPANGWALRDNDASATDPNHAGYHNTLYFDWHVGRVAVNG